MFVPKSGKGFETFQDSENSVIVYIFYMSESFINDDEGQPVYLITVDLNPEFEDSIIDYIEQLESEALKFKTFRADSADASRLYVFL